MKKKNCDIMIPSAYFKLKKSLPIRHTVASKLLLARIPAEPELLVKHIG